MASRTTSVHGSSTLDPTEHTRVRAAAGSSRATANGNTSSTAWGRAVWRLRPPECALEPVAPGWPARRVCNHSASVGGAARIRWSIAGATGVASGPDRQPCCVSLRASIAGVPCAIAQAFETEAPGSSGAVALRATILATVASDPRRLEHEKRWHELEKPDGSAPHHPVRGRVRGPDRYLHMAGPRPDSPLMDGMNAVTT